MHGANLESRPWPRLKGTEDLGERHLERRKTIDDGWEMAVEWDQNGIILGFYEIQMEFACIPVIGSCSKGSRPVLDWYPLKSRGCTCSSSAFMKCFYDERVYWHQDSMSMILAYPIPNLYS